MVVVQKESRRRCLSRRRGTSGFSERLLLAVTIFGFYLIFRDDNVVSWQTFDSEFDFWKNSSPSSYQHHVPYDLSIISKVNASEIYLRVSNEGKIHPLGMIQAAIREAKITAQAKNAGVKTAAEMQAFFQSHHDINNEDPVIHFPNIRIDRIYYINMDHRVKRRQIMNSWISATGIPYQRISGLSGTAQDHCVAGKDDQGPRCRGIAGVAKSNLQIMEHYNTTGYTLVIEDDFVIRDLPKLLASIPLVPDDWDVIRWDCWSPPFASFQKYSWPYAFSTTIDPNTCPPNECDYCGGNHVTLWNGRAATTRRTTTSSNGDGDGLPPSVQKLHQVWSRKPYNTVDCALSDPSLKSYCINIGIGEFHKPLQEMTDIPKLPVPSAKDENRSATHGST